MTITILDSILMLGVAIFALMQAQLESKHFKCFFAEFSTWSVAFLLMVVMFFKVFDRFHLDPASFLDLLKHLGFFLLAGRYYFLTKSLDKFRE